MVGRLLLLLYGLVCYLASMATTIYAVGFIGGFLTPTRLDGPREGSLVEALSIDCGLLLLFSLQHSGMARPRFKRWLTRWIPAAAERSTYVLMSSLALFLLFWLWRPLGGSVWEMQGEAARSIMSGLYAFGWATVLGTTFLINHFDLFGLRQPWLAFRGISYTQLKFTTPGPYRLVRHPLYVGWLTVFWAASTMTSAHLLFAVVTTVYILAAIRWEERDLVDAHPEYAVYRRRVPMLLPRLFAGRSPQPETSDSPAAGDTTIISRRSPAV